MSSQQEKSTPKDSQIIMKIMSDLGIQDYEQQVINHLLQFNYKYTSLLMEEAKVCSTFANKDEVDVDDVKTAIQLVQNSVFFKSPARDELIKASNEVNKKPLPAIKPANGLRIPEGGLNFIQEDYKLKTDLNTGKSVMKKCTKLTAAEMLNATKQTEAIDNAETVTQSDLNLDDLTDIDIDEFIGSQQNNQGSDNDFNLDSLLCDSDSLLF